MIDFSLFYAEQISTLSGNQYDIFISASDGCDRTLIPYNEVNAKTKVFLTFPQQERMNISDGCYSNSHIEEDLYVQQMVKNIPLDLSMNSKICIDCSGFIIPHLLYLIGYLYYTGIKRLDIIYNEPEKYNDKENTKFSDIYSAPKPIKGFEAINSDLSNDEILIIESGFQSELIRQVIRNKAKVSDRHFIIGFPSLHADMYQHNRVQLYQAKYNIGSNRVLYHKSPAYDPFITANKLCSIINSYNTSNYIYHIAPLSTKPQAIGAALCYLAIKDNVPIDIIYPPSEIYFTKNTTGIHRRWLFTIEFDAIRNYANTTLRS